MPALADIEAASLATWPALESVTDGRWLARFAAGHTRRANSILSLDPEDEAEAPARLARLAEAYRARGLAPVFRVSPLAGPAVVAALDAAGWAEEDRSLVLVAALDGPSAAPAGIEAFAPTDPAWLDVQQRLNGLTQEARPVLAAMLVRLPEASRGLVVLAEGAPVAAALVAVSEGIAFCSLVVVAAEHRRQGHGLAVMQAALDWAWRHGAGHAAVQVLAANAPALSLYRAFGFAERFGYCYRRGAR